MKSFNKIKHFADKAFIRPDRTEVLSEDLQTAERRIELIKQTCESTSKKVALCLQCPNKDGQPPDKRLKKVPEVVLGLIMAENGEQLEKAYGETVLGQVLTAAGGIEQLVGQEMVKYEDKIEDSILGPIQKLMENEIPSIYKIKRTLSKLTSDMDNARAKLNQANRHSMSSTTTGKIDNIKDDLEDTQQKVEQCRDNLAAEMYQLIARESEISQHIVNFLQYQRDYHKTVYSFVNELLPHVESILAKSYHKPVFGVDLEEHLNGCGRTIAYPLEVCVCGLTLTGLEEEGLFRIAGSASKVKKLKAAFDARLMDLNGLVSEFSDPHVIGNALKCYLRELPKPLLTYDLYDDWMEAVQVVNPQTRLQHIWTVVQKLQTSHKPNYDNLCYLIKFLSVLSKNHHLNKMTPANIAIVIGPNLLWKEIKSDDPTDPAMGMNMTMTHLYTSLVDQLVTYADYFFGEPDLDFFVTCVRPSDSDLVPNGQLADDTNLNPNGGDNEGGFVSAKRSQSNSSLEDHNNSPPPGSPKPVLRTRKNKPAPVPPINLSNSSKSSTPTNKVAPASVEITKPPISSSSTSSSPSNKSGSDNNSSNSSGENSGLKRLPSARKIERDGVWIPPSPNQMNNRKLMTGKDNENVVTKPKVTPPKPPQPVFPYGIGGKVETNSPVQIYATTLRHKSSFNSGGGGGRSDSTDNTTTQNPNSSSSQANSSLQYSNSLPRGFHTENSYKNQRAPRPPSVFAAIPTVPTTNSSNTTSSSSSASSATIFNHPNPIDINKKGGTTTSSVHRHQEQQQQQLLDESLSEQQSQHTVPQSESNDLQQQRPQSEQRNVVEDHQVGQVSSSSSSSNNNNNNVGIGFENIETEIRKLSLDSNNPISSQEEIKEDNSIINNSFQQQAVPLQTHHSTPSSTTTLPTDRPVPAPRSSLFQNSSSSKDKEMPIVKERPSLMAKPRDLAKRTTNYQCPNTGGANNELKQSCEDTTNPSHPKPQGLHNSTEDSRTIDISTSSDVRNGGFLPPQSPQSRNRRAAGLSAFRVNLPQPPPNPQQQKNGPKAESTDL